MSRKKVPVQAEEPLDKFFEGQEFSVSADKLIEAIKHYHTAIKGVSPKGNQVYADACKIIRSRIDD